MRMVYTETFIVFRIPLAFQDKQPNDPDFECISRDNRNPLLHDLADFQLCYKAIPHHHTFTQKRADMLRQKKIEITESQRQFLEGDNQPISIKNEHELAHLYLDQVYSILPGCNISNLNMDAILVILSRASCFHENLREKYCEEQVALLQHGVVD